jgi:addiction module HigA family antidote
MPKRKRHPGAILRKNYLEPHGISVTEAAERIGVTRQALNNVLNGKAGISSDMAIRLGRLFAVKPETIQQIQNDYELTQTRLARATRDRGKSGSYYVSSSDIASWAESIATAPYTFPQLVRMLIRANAPSDAIVDFPAHTDARRPGWDGLVENSKASAYVPAGQSGWEVSTEAHPQTKAEGDYQTRKGNSLGLTPRATTFVAVSARKWAKKRDWVIAKKKEDFWSNVIAYDAADIEQWLEICPEVAIWFASQTGRRPRGVQSLEEFWNEYRLSTDPVTPPELLLAGRKKEAEAVAQWLEAGTRVLRVLADSADEALAFVSAVAVTNQTTGGGCECAEIIVATDSEQIRQLMGAPHQLTFGWRIDDPSLLGIAVDKGHRVLVPLSRSAAFNENADVQLTRLGRAGFVAAIKDTLPREPIDIKEPGREEEAKRKEEAKREEEANRRVRKSGRSLTVYRRMFAAAGVAQLPAWGTAEVAQELLPVLLAGGWTETNDSDRLAISKLAGTDYEIVSRTVMRWKNQPDAPVRRIGEAWSLVAPLDAWSLLSRFISDIDLERFSQVVLDVLGEGDPKLQLVPSERWLANLRGKEFKYSNALRQGLGDSIILLEVVGEEYSPSKGNTTARRSHRLVSKLLDGKSGEKRWASLSSLLPRLAEAAPEAFLDALETNLTKTPSEVLGLFEDEGFPLGGGSRHTHLLWALETLAWYPEYLPRVALALAKLARLAPKVKIVNSPQNSLREIFCMWHRNNAASLDDRLQILDRLNKCETEVGWELLYVLLPSPHEVSGNTAEPRWRPRPEAENVTYGELWRAHKELVARALRLADLDGRRLAKLCPKIPSWPPEYRQLFIEHLKRFSLTSEDVAARTELWKSVLEFISSHRTFRDAEWALPEDQIAPLDEILDSLKPSDVGESKLWLFDEYLPHLPDSRGGSVEMIDKEVAEARRKAVNEIMEPGGLDALFVLARRVKLPWQIGISLAEVVTDPQTEREVLERTMAAEDQNHRKLGRGFVVCRYTIGNREWSEGLLHTDMFKTWPPSKQADFCLGLPEEPSTWELVSSLGPAVEDRYWAEAHVFLSRLEGSDDAEFAIGKLLESRRTLYAFDQAALHPGKLSVAILIEILENTLVALAKAGDRLPVDAGFTWGLGRILGKLRASGEVPVHVLGKLEWEYLPLLRLQEQPVTLHAALRSDPRFFATLVALAFKSEPEEDAKPAPSELSEETRNRARLAWEVLESWHTPPGSRPDGTLDPLELNSWVRNARSLCSAQHQAAIGDERIGRVLAYAPADEDGMWPHGCVRELLAETDSRHLESGLHSGRVNQRGVTARNPLEGGRQEREIAKTYRNWAKTVAAKWPQTARLLNSLAETYENFGAWHDLSAEQLDLEH